MLVTCNGKTFMDSIFFVLLKFVADIVIVVPRFTYRTILCCRDDEVGATCWNILTLRGKGILSRSRGTC